MMWASVFVILTELKKLKTLNFNEEKACVSFLDLLS